jgi:hypothetical protein
MGAVEQKRLVSVTVIGWIFIAVAALGILSGLMTLLMYASMKQIEGFEFPPSREDMLGPATSEMPPVLVAVFGAVPVFFRYFDAMIIFQILFAIFTLIAGIQFLKLQAWARAALEFISWWGLVGLICFYAFWLAVWISVGRMMSAIPMAEGGPPPFFLVFGGIAATLTLLFWAIPHIVVIKFLRGRTIREATSHSREAAGEVN